MAIKSQHYFSKFCPTSKLHTSGIFLKTVLKNNILQPCYSYHYYLIYISEVSELNERHKRIKSKKMVEKMVQAAVVLDIHYTFLK